TRPVRITRCMNIVKLLLFREKREEPRNDRAGRARPHPADCFAWRGTCLPNVAGFAWKTHPRRGVRSGWHRLCSAIDLSGATCHLLSAACLFRNSAMILPEVTLIVTEGALQRRELHFHSPIQCVVGRAEDCAIRLGRGFGAGEISRHHCLLDIDPPHVWVRDLGSLNGTFVNSENIG